MLIPLLLIYKVIYRGDILRELIGNYFEELDRSIEVLSNKYEGQLINMPSWVLNNRKIVIGEVIGSNVTVIKITPQESLDNDVIELTKITTDVEYQQFYAPLWENNGRIKHLPKHSHFYQFGDLLLIESENINAIPAFYDKSLYTEVTNDIIHEYFSEEKAKQEALDLWNNNSNKLPVGKSFVHNLQIIFDRFQSIIKRKSFLERRIHRYLNEYSKYLLPNHVDKFYEQPLYLRGEKRVADFILKREDTFPSLLIELENPSLKAFKKNGEPTAESNHAKNQISEWTRFIEQNPKNTEGELSFLNGPKSRLVIIGRGLEYIEEMENSKYTDTIVWTYDFLIKESKKRCNNDIKAQCELLGIKEPNYIK